MAIIAAAAEGRSVPPYKFELACDFFLNLTGINIHRERDTAGHWKSTKATKKALPALEGWLAENHRRLFWDRKSNSIKVCTLNASRGGQVAGKPGVETVWAAHSSVFEDLESGINFPLVEFQDAAEFFSELTGIDIHGGGNYSGFYPTSETTEDFKSIRAWYERNRENLCWDEAAGAIGFCTKGTLGAGE